MLFERGIDRNKQGDTRFTGDAVAQEVDGFDMQVGCINSLADAHGGFVPLNICKGALHRFLHRAFDTTRKAQLTSAWRAADLDAVQSYLALIINRCCIH